MNKYLNKILNSSIMDKSNRARHITAVQLETYSKS